MFSAIEIADDQPTTLTATEAETLGRHEFIIERGIGAFAEVGSALLAIRDGRLYRATHPTFEAYCRERWDMNRRYANRIIGAAQIVAELEMGPIGPIPTTESQARPIAGLPFDQARQVWDRAVTDSGGSPTARDVEAAKTAVLGPAVPDYQVDPEDDHAIRPTEPESAPAPYPPTHIGLPVPAGPGRQHHDIIVKSAAEARAQERADLFDSLATLRDTLSPECREKFDLDAYACRQSQDLLDELRKRYRAEYAIVGKGRPGQFVRVLSLVLDCMDPSQWAVCGSCGGQSCESCKHLGYVVTRESKGAN